MCMCSLNIHVRLTFLHDEGTQFELIRKHMGDSEDGISQWSRSQLEKCKLLFIEHQSGVRFKNIFSSDQTDIVISFDLNTGFHFSVNTVGSIRSFRYSEALVTALFSDLSTFYIQIPLHEQITHFLYLLHLKLERSWYHILVFFPSRIATSILKYCWPLFVTHLELPGLMHPCHLSVPSSNYHPNI